MSMKSFVKSLFRRAGYEVIHISRPEAGEVFPADFSPADIELYLRVRPFTQTSPERIFTLARAVEYIVAGAIPGSFVECGVWKGGSMMAVAMVLQRLDASDAQLYLYDTYEGMPEPSAEDGNYAADRWEKSAKGTSEHWNYASIEEVRKNLQTTNYSQVNLHFVKGKVEDTIPQTAPDRISLLRLDTDFYESTRHELEHLFPRLSPGGVLIVDDYGCYHGARKAVDDYVRENKTPLLLNRIDRDARIAVKGHGRSCE